MPSRCIVAKYTEHNRLLQRSSDATCTLLDTHLQALGQLGLGVAHFQVWLTQAQFQWEKASLLKKVFGTTKTINTQIN